MPWALLTQLVIDAHAVGWCTARVPLGEFRRLAASEGWEEVKVRQGDPVMSELTPRSRGAARPRSLSATYGLDAQPLHTDGAHLEAPPDFVVLQALESSPTPTLLWNIRKELSRQPSGLLDSVDQGVFLVRNGRRSFYSTVTSRLGVRFDPGCMAPCDERARVVEEWLRQAIDWSVPHEWRDDATLLLIDNRSTLHARAAIRGDTKRVLHRVAFRTGAPA